ncbi:MAG TPA: N-acetylmuramoyl-L-alanine amidase [Candidatus Acidoferrales bacterium]|nr:N-acetylmuramoyl-L-alanine amidase [Candidatus Acidoferrales bacterium]
MSKVAVLVLCGALAWLAGCATSEQPPPPDWSATTVAGPTNGPTAFAPIPTVVQTNLPALAKTNAPAAGRTNPPVLVRTNFPPLMDTNRPVVSNLAEPRMSPVYTWTSLKRWALEKKIDPPTLLTKSPLVTYSVNSPRGAMILAIGIREATWNGVALHLGFAPEIIDGEVYVHGLDLQKSFEPFLCDGPPLFGTNRVIVIDPGHGGMNAGTIAVGDHRPEKTFTLDWAQRLQPLLEQEGWRVILTRTNDVDIALSNRVTVAETDHADLFISFHFNSAAPDPKPVGLATFCLTPAGMPSTVTRGYPDLWFQSFPNNKFDAENVRLAERLQRALLHATGLEDRGVNRARFIGVLRGQHRPAVLIEAGFLSNPHEARRIESADFREKLAEAVAAALK